MAAVACAAAAAVPEAPEFVRCEEDCVAAANLGLPGVGVDCAMPSSNRDMVTSDPRGLRGVVARGDASAPDVGKPGRAEALLPRAMGIV